MNECEALVSGEVEVRRKVKEEKVRKKTTHLGEGVRPVGERELGVTCVEGRGFTYVSSGSLSLSLSNITAHLINIFFLEDSHMNICLIGVPFHSYPSNSVWRKKMDDF